MIQFLGALYILLVSAVAFYGVAGMVTLWLYHRHRHDPTPSLGDLPPGSAPSVTVQLPVYNEPLVIERLIDAAVALDYPQDRLQIQVLDDSVDETTALAEARIAQHQAAGVDIQMVHRDARLGYKAGALQGGLAQASGEYVAIFDADFVPQPGFLQETIPHFLEAPDLGMVQTRWGHLNAAYTHLTLAQAISLDKHFAVEQVVRHRADLFPKFNGSGGVWRVSCIRSAGGWLADTVCEDLDLSTRAQLEGWQFRFLCDVVSPAELPPQMTAFKMQQARWAKGSLQCVIKHWLAILRSRRHSLLGRVYALFSMTAYVVHPLLIGLLLLLPPLLLWEYEFSPWLAWLGIAGLAQPLLFLLAQQSLYRDWPRRTLVGLPALVLVAVGLAPSNSWSIWEAIVRRSHEFHRTPKFNLLPRPEGGWSAGGSQDHFKVPFSPLILGELALALYALLGIGLALGRGRVGFLPFLFLCAVSFGYTAALSWRETTRSV
jgi:cellulose synthase/poly-beta-1,6-N-acetylglucosamine synthase-like glycosyltransferase